jgi:YbbR domain-containing protein
MALLIDSVRRNFGLKVTAVVAAIVLWFTFNYFSTAHLGYSKTLDVPLLVRGASAGLVTSSPVAQVTIEVSGPRADIDSLTATDFSAYVDCSGKLPGLYSLAVNVVGQDADKVKTVKPSQVVITLDRYGYRTVPVIARDSQGALLANAVLDPPLIQVAGAQSEVSDVFAAEISVPEPGSLPAGFSAEMTPVAVDKRMTPVPRANALGVVRVTAAMPPAGRVK